MTVHRASCKNISLFFFLTCNSNGRLLDWSKAKRPRDKSLGTSSTAPKWEKKKKKFSLWPKWALSRSRMNVFVQWRRRGGVNRGVFMKLFWESASSPYFHLALTTMLTQPAETLQRFSANSDSTTARSPLTSCHKLWERIFPSCIQQKAADASKIWKRCKRTRNLGVM